MREELQQLNHLAEVLYNESRDLYTVGKVKAGISKADAQAVKEKLEAAGCVVEVK